MPDTFEIETREGVRRVEFDPDILRNRDVRVLVDGERAGEMPLPRPETPYQEVAFQLGEHTLLAVAHLSAEPAGVDSMGLRYDLFADGRSLSDGSSLAEARARVPAPGQAYPELFRIIDLALVVVPAAAAPGFAIGITHGVNGLGWPTAIGLLGLLVGAIVVATLVASRAWARIRVDLHRSAPRRAVLGCAVVVGTYGVAGAAALVMAMTFAAANR